MRSALQSYVKVMDLADTALSSVQFKDTSGVLLDCNYFSIQCRNVSGGATPEHGYFFAIPSGVYFASVLASATAGGDSGGAGIAGTADATVEMSLVPPSRARAVTIYNKLGSKGRFIITYGNIVPVNIQRDKDRNWTPIGN